MTSTTTSTTNKKTYKWSSTTQNAAAGKTHRVQKRTTSKNSRTRSVFNAATAIMTTVAAETNKQQQQQQDPYTKIEQLQNDLPFTYDTIATITVHFDSLHHAYISSKPELDKNKNATRLCEMEKELLTAYDDLGLQVNHLERKIVKYEKRLDQLRELTKLNAAPITTSTISNVCTTSNGDLARFNGLPSKYQPAISSKDPGTPVLKQAQQQYPQHTESEQTPFLQHSIATQSSIISSPCSSTDSLTAEMKIESPDSLYYNYSIDCNNYSEILQPPNVMIEQEARLYDSEFWYLPENDYYEFYSSTNNNKLNNTFMLQQLQQQPWFCQSEGVQEYGYYSPNSSRHEQSNDIMYNDMSTLSDYYYPASIQYC